MPCTGMENNFSVYVSKITSQFWNHIALGPKNHVTSLLFHVGYSCWFLHNTTNQKRAPPYELHEGTARGPRTRSFSNIILSGKICSPPRPFSSSSPPSSSFFLFQFSLWFLRGTFLRGIEGERSYMLWTPRPCLRIWKLLKKKIQEDCLEKTQAGLSNLDRESKAGKTVVSLTVHCCLHLKPCIVWGHRP